MHCTYFCLVSWYPIFSFNYLKHQNYRLLYLPLVDQQVSFTCNHSFLLARSAGNSWKVNGSGHRLASLYDLQLFTEQIFLSLFFFGNISEPSVVVWYHVQWYHDSSKLRLRTHLQPYTSNMQILKCRNMFSIVEWSSDQHVFVNKYHVVIY